MFRRGPENLPNFRFLCIQRPDCVVTVRHANAAVHVQVDNRPRFSGKAVNMSRRMVVDVDYESNPAKPKRNRRAILTQPRLGFNEKSY